VHRDLQVPIPLLLLLVRRFFHLCVKDWFLQNGFSNAASFNLSYYILIDLTAGQGGVELVADKKAVVSGG